MNGRQIEIFHAVMKSGTVTEAASRLGISQPAVTSSLKQIEASLGFNLFHRSGGRLQPTAEARILNNEAERIQGSMEVFRVLADRLKTDITQHLRIVSPNAFSHELIPETLAGFRAVNEHCLIDITTQHHDQILDDIASDAGANNLAFTFGLDSGHGVSPSTKIGSRHIGQVDIVALVPWESELAHTGTASVAELADDEWIGTFPGEPLGNAVEHYMRSAGIAENYSIRVHTHSLAVSLVSKGVGFALIDSITANFARNHYGKKAFHIIPLKDAPSLPVTAIYSYQRPLGAFARQFIDMFRSNLSRINT